VEENNLWTTW